MGQFNRFHLIYFQFGHCSVPCTLSNVFFVFDDYSLVLNRNDKKMTRNQSCAQWAHRNRELWKTMTSLNHNIQKIEIKRFYLLITSVWYESSSDTRSIFYRFGENKHLQLLLLRWYELCSALNVALIEDLLIFKWRARELLLLRLFFRCPFSIGFSLYCRCLHACDDDTHYYTRRASGDELSTLSGQNQLLLLFIRPGFLLKQINNNNERRTKEKNKNPELNSLYALSLSLVDNEKLVTCFISA